MICPKSPCRKYRPGGRALSRWQSAPKIEAAGRIEKCNSRTSRSAVGIVPSRITDGLAECSSLGGAGRAIDGRVSGSRDIQSAFPSWGKARSEGPCPSAVRWGCRGQRRLRGQGRSSRRSSGSRNFLVLEQSSCCRIQLAPWQILCRGRSMTP